MWETAPMPMKKYILEVFWHIIQEIFTTPMRMINYILGPQETYEEVVCNNPLNTRHKKQKDSMASSYMAYMRKKRQKNCFKIWSKRGYN